jgi:hypothetical protein
MRKSLAVILPIAFCALVMLPASVRADLVENAAAPDPNDRLFISVNNHLYDVDVPPMGGSDSLQSLQPVTPTPIPLPPTWQTAGVGLLVVAVISSMHRSRRLKRLAIA